MKTLIEHVTVVTMDDESFCMLTWQKNAGCHRLSIAGMPCSG